MEDAFTHPLLEAAVAGLVGRVALGQIGPLRAGAQDPQDAVEHLTRLAAWPALAIGPAGGFGYQRGQQFPLLIGVERRVSEDIVLSRLADSHFPALS